MTTIRRVSRPADRYSSIANSAVRDGRLSFKARGLLAYLLSHQVGWVISLDALVASGPDGRTAINTALAELKEHGYIVVSQARENGRFTGSIWEVTDEPVEEVTTPQSDFPTADRPTADGEPLKKNNIQKTNYLRHGDAVADRVEPVDKSDPRFQMTAKRESMFLDVLVQCGQAHNYERLRDHIRSLPYAEGQDVYAKWTGIRTAIRKGKTNRRDDVNALLQRAGVAEISEADWREAIGADDGAVRLSGF